MHRSRSPVPPAAPGVAHAHPAPLPATTSTCAICDQAMPASPDQDGAIGICSPACARNWAAADD